MVCPEVAPFSKTGGLADVCAALPPALVRLGVEVSIVTPLYRAVRDSEIPIRDTGRRVTVPMAGESRTAALHQADRDGVALTFVECDDYYDRDELYGPAPVDYPDNAARFAFLARAALEIARPLRPDVLHAHDWQSALALPLLKTVYADFLPRTRGVITVHNLAYQGLFPSKDWGITGLDPGLFNWQHLEFYGRISYLKGGLIFADGITTVSPTYAREIQREEHGCGLDGLLRSRADRIRGILNGADYSIWDPRHDPLIPSNYSSRSMAGKVRCKEALQKKLGLNSGHAPLIGMITRLAEQKGLDVFLRAADRLLAGDAQYAILGSGNPYYEEHLRGLAARHPGRFSVSIGFDDRLAHEIEAGADMFLMPSRFEPCGLNQIYSLRYGTIPVVRSTGGLADTVVDGATGFVFNDYTPEALAGCVDRALAAFRDGETWKKMVRAAMKLDYSWDRSAGEYLSLYESLR
jgi:starch synthase